MDEETVEVIDIQRIVGPNPSSRDEILAVVETVNEWIAQDVAGLVKDGYTLDQIEIVRHPPELDANRLRLRFTVTGKRPV